MKTLKLSILFTALLAVTALTSCRFNCIKGSGHSASENRKVADFTSIDVSGGYKIILKQDSTLILNITADDNVFKYLRTTVEGGKLRIYTQKNICTEKAITITLGVRNLEAIKGSGAVEITAEGKIQVKDLDMHFTGASKVDLDLTADNVTTKGSGATEIKLKGQAKTHTLHLTGSGKVEALDFVVGKYDIETTGASDCKVNATTELNIHTTGAADIKYRGNAAVNSSKTGAASIQKVD